MIALTLEGLVERKLRSALTAIAVLLGVAMIAGTYVLTDQIRSGFEDLQKTGYSAVDVELSPKDAFTSQFSMPRAADERLVARVRRVPGVATATGTLWAPGGLVIDGDFKKSAGGGGTIVTAELGEPFSAATNVQGRLPEHSGEVALIRATAEKYGLGPGDRIGIATRRGVCPSRLSAHYEYGQLDVGGPTSSPLASGTSRRGSTARAR